eukprot:GHVL01009228.1.p1 GENE.GHVL01009228.1~~GHVL01009228.1.p1  ORF type:complete len:221 (-),score=36.90 GHVL01009228.1:416-1078(-)
MHLTRFVLTFYWFSFNFSISSSYRFKIISFSSIKHNYIVRSSLKLHELKSSPNLPDSKYIIELSVNNVTQKQSDFPNMINEGAGEAGVSVISDRIEDLSLGAEQKETIGQKKQKENINGFKKEGKKVMDIAIEKEFKESIGSGSQIDHLKKDTFTRSNDLEKSKKDVYNEEKHRQSDNSKWSKFNSEKIIKEIDSSDKDDMKIMNRNPIRVQTIDLKKHV